MDRLVWKGSRSVRLKDKTPLPNDTYMPLLYDTAAAERIYGESVRIIFDIAPQRD